MTLFYRQRIGKKLPKPRKTFNDEVILETENWEETAQTSKAILEEAILQAENWEKTAKTFHDEVIPETENWEETAQTSKPSLMRPYSTGKELRKNCQILENLP